MSYQLPIYMYKMRLVYVTDRSSSDGYEILGLWISVVDGKSSNSNTFPMKCIIFDVLSIQRRNTGLVLFTSFADNQFQDLENEMCKPLHSACSLSLISFCGTWFFVSFVRKSSGHLFCL